MKVLFLGDVVGKRGLDYLTQLLPELRKEYKPSLVIVNAENTTNGKGLSKKDYKQFMKLNISCLTMGNHTFRNAEINEYIDESKVVRPLNMENVKGSGFIDINFNGKIVTVVNLIGTVNISVNEKVNNPFKEIKELLKNHKFDYLIVDMHAEATSEKIAMGLMLDGVASAVVGTHTHVQTSDARILPNGTLYISDLGMTGPLDGVIGVNKDIILKRFLGVSTDAFKIEENGKVQLNGVLLDLDKKKITLVHKES